MKIRVVYILMIAAALGVGAAYRVLRMARSEAAPVQPAAAVPEIEKQAMPPGPVAVPEPRPEPVQKKTVPQFAAPSRSMNTQDPDRRYWDGQAQRFDRMLEKLSRETDPAKRINLIRSMARYVRVDTPAAIEWAMNLADPGEQRAALEAINKNALVGIGARIEMDETGLPKIRETTPLSAVESTGKVEQGDYIVGMVDANGQPTYFDGLTLRQIVQFLRGEPGTEVRLLMERGTTGGGTEPYAFDVPVQRSLIVVEPPF